MAIHRIQINDFDSTDYELIAIHSNLEDYRLAYLLNSYLDIKLKRKPQDLDYKYFAATYAIYEWDNEKKYMTWNLISNVCKKEEDGLQSSGSLFDAQEKVLKTYNLIPELKNVDFLVKITDENEQFNEKQVLDKIQSIPQVITAYSVDTEQLKSKDYLIF